MSLWSGWRRQGNRVITGHSQASVCLAKKALCVWGTLDYVWIVIQRADRPAALCILQFLFQNQAKLISLSALALKHVICKNRNQYCIVVWNRWQTQHWSERVCHLQLLAIMCMAYLAWDVYIGAHGRCRMNRGLKRIQTREVKWRMGKDVLQMIAKM